MGLNRIAIARRTIEEIQVTRTINTKQWKALEFSFEAFLLFCQLDETKQQKFIDSVVENFNH